MTMTSQAMQPSRCHRLACISMAAAVGLAACGERAEPGASSATTPATTSAAADGTVDNAAANAAYDTTLNMPQLMELVLEPAAMALWESAGWVLDRDEGYYELYPESDEEWEAVLAQAATLIETGNILALPGRAEDDNWLIYTAGLSQAGRLAMEAIEARDKEAYFQAGAQIYSVCTACHQAYSPQVNYRFITE